MGGKVGTETVSTGVELRRGKRMDSIRIYFTYRGVDCREPLKLAGTKQNIAYAVRRRGEVLNAIERGTFVYTDFFPDSPRARLFAPPDSALPAEPAPARVPTIGELLGEYLTIAERNLALSSYNCYRQIADIHLLPAWGTKPVTELTTRELRQWIMTLDVKRKTVQLILTPLRNTLEHALVDGLIESNPFDSIRLNKILARDQMQSDYRADPFDIEYIAQEWTNVSFVTHQVQVAGAFVDGEAKRTAKTAAGLRFTPRPIGMRQCALLFLRRDHQELRDRAGTSAPLSCAGGVSAYRRVST